MVTVTIIHYPTPLDALNVSSNLVQIKMHFCLYILLDVLEDTKQQMYTQCSFSYETEAGSVVSCHNPVLRYLNPRLCGGHWDQSQVCLSETEDEEENDCQPVGDVVDKKGPILIKK